MLAPFRWIQDYTDVQCTPAELADRMVMTGNGVEHILYGGSDVENVLVGRIDKIVQHPNADRLVVCTVDVGREAPLQIVTGAPNVFEGAVVPVAVAPARLPGGEIKKGKLRGELSEGMLCSGEELLLSESDVEGAGVDGILILPDSLAIGSDVLDALGIRSAVLDFEVGANRPDCLSMMGIAREAAAALHTTFREPEADYETGNTDISQMVTVDVEAPDLCTRYIAAGVNDVKIEPSPEWMQRRLVEAGIRPINNIVDITNFVMLETGQPMHAFDADRIRKKEIIVRRAHNGEKMQTLDGKERTFTDSMLLICDGRGPVGIAGVMGGLDSEITAATKRVVFEAAKFGYGNIRQTSRALGLSTESSMRFSKGVDANMSMFAMRRALALVEALNAGVPAAGMIDIMSEDASPRIIKTTGARTNAILGTTLSAREMQQLLERAFIHTGLIGDELICTIPSFRADIIGQNDIAEEVARMYGYDNIPETMPRVELRAGHIPEVEQVKDCIAQFLVDNGFYECMSYSFAGRADYEYMCMEPPSAMVQLLNPLGDDRAFMRQTLIPAMLRSVASNLNQGTRPLRLFEVARTFTPLEGEPLPEEHQVLCIALTGDKADFAVLRGYIDSIVRLAVRRPVRVKAAEEPFLSPAAAGRLIVKGTDVGFAGQIAPQTARNFEIDQKTFIAQIDLDALLKVEPARIHVSPLPRHPAAMRDLAVVVDADVAAGDILEEARKAGGATLEEVSLLSVYSGDKIDEGKKSVAVSLTLRGKDKTLTDEQADGAVRTILKALERKFDARLR